MTPAFQMYGVRGYLGDNRVVLPQLAAGSVHCVVTSPPYWGQRDYGTATWEGGDPGCDHKADGKPRASRPPGSLTGGTATVDVAAPLRGNCPKCGARRVDQQIGLEENPDTYVRELVSVFRECKRVMRDDATLWLNLGDKFASNPAKGRSGSGKNSDYLGGIDATGQTRGACDLPEKNLMGIPWRVAIAMQADGWVLRADIIWHKPNCMPSSAVDRPTINHEYVFMFAKGSDYYYDGVAIKERSVTAPHKPGNVQLDASRNDQDRVGEVWAADGMSNKRSVWTVNVAAEREHHFASYPPKLILPCILAGTSEYGCCAAKKKKLRPRRDLSLEDQAKVAAFLLKKGFVF